MMLDTSLERFYVLLMNNRDWFLSESELASMSFSAWDEFVESHVASKQPIDIPLPITVDLGPIDIIEAENLIAA